MDEADRMIDMGFEEDVRSIMSHFKVGVVEKHLGLFSSRTYGAVRSLAVVSTPDPPLLRYHAS